MNDPMKDIIKQMDAEADALERRIRAEANGDLIQVFEEKEFMDNQGRLVTRRTLSWQPKARKKR